MGGKKAARGASAAALSRALAGIDFPKEEAELIEHAQNAKASIELVEILRKLPDRKYNNMAEVRQGLGKVR